jgi:hypothetical protein
MKRELEIDAARGLMLAWMTLTHLPTALSPWVNQPFGYISASEGFIFLSALFTGRIYYRLLTRSGPSKMSAKLLGRTLRLYGYHVLLLFFAFAVVARYALGAQSQSLYNLLEFCFAAGTSRALVDSLLLVYRPPLLDIIPLYLIFLLISPVLLLASRRIAWKYILSGIFTLWMMAQFGLREASYAFLAHHTGLRIPLNEMGAFNLWAWQLVWVLGIWCGVRWAKEDLPAENWAGRVWIPAAVIAAAMLGLRYAQIYGLDLGRFAFLFDKWNLGVMRLFDFAAIAALLIRFRAIMKPLAIRPLVLMGQSSLQVFCTHFIFCFIGIGMLGNAERLFGWRQAALIVVTFAGLLIVAKLKARPELDAQASGEKTAKPAAPQIRPAENGLTRAA